MDDPARRDPPEEIAGRVSAVESIVSPRRARTDRPSLPWIFRTIYEVQRETSGYSTDERILRAHVHALERLYPRVRIAMRVSGDARDRALPIQHATHRIATGADLSITEAGLARVGLDHPQPRLRGVSVRSTYVPFLGAESDDEVHFRDGFDAPLVVQGEVIGTVAVEFDRRRELPGHLEESVLITATQASAALDSAQVRREAIHLRDYLEKLLEHAKIPVLVVGRDRGIRVVSGAFAQITGLDQHQLLKKDLLDLAPKSERVRVLAAFVSALRGRTVPPFLLRLPRGDNRTAQLRFKLAPILDSEGRVAGVIAIGQDRTEVHELEGQVIQAEKLATLGQLAAGIVHEINNPLTSITVYGEYILGKLARIGADEHDIRRVERILGGADRILSFTRNLLSYARPSREEPQAVALNRSLEDAVGFCEHVIQEASMTVTRSYADGLPPVRAVPDQLHQVFVNLITNACNAALDEGGQVRLTTRVAVQDRVEVIIEDNGIGIEKRQLSRVFEPFFSTRRRGKGTGLGLPIVKSILEQHQGSIEIQSNPGFGTKVRIELCPYYG